MRINSAFQKLSPQFYKIFLKACILRINSVFQIQTQQVFENEHSSYICLVLDNCKTYFIFLQYPDNTNSVHTPSNWGFNTTSTVEKAGRIRIKSFVNVQHTSKKVYPSLSTLAFWGINAYIISLVLRQLNTRNAYIISLWPWYNLISKNEI